MPCSDEKGEFKLSWDAASVEVGDADADEADDEDEFESFELLHNEAVSLLK